MVPAEAGALSRHGPPTLTLLTDFGLRDGYAAAVKGVLLARCPDARVVDLSHEIPPGEVAAGAYVLAQAAPWFPPGTVHLAVVDPGVGTERRAVACALDRHCYVAPDNGLLDEVLEGAAEVRAYAIQNAALWHGEVSPVFHGRDVLAPVAAHLAAGGALDAVGPEVAAGSLVRLERPAVEESAGRRVGRVVHVDRFGNLVTDLRVGPGATGRVELAGRAVPLRRTYGDVDAGELVALRGSSGRLEIGRNRGSAADLLGAAPGLVVTWHLRADA